MNPSTRARSVNHVIRNFLVVSAVALATPAVVLAHDESPGGERAEHRLDQERGDRSGHQGGKSGHKRGERMFDQLDLSDEQRVQARELMKTYHQKMRAERELLMQEMDQILTPAQREKARDLRHHHEEKRERREKREAG